MIEIDPAGTGKGWSRWRHIAPGNRNRNLLRCRARGLAHRADIQAALNIRLRGILSRQQSEQDGPPSCSAEARAIGSGATPDEGAGKPPASAGGS
ncbi:MAG: hypothetical protein J2P48_21080 [Alphaproteobacteria bacterium]|nr:hypothetical protein [Alphaproteobacteria bacterium]